jgi:hypothetical protein
LSFLGSLFGTDKAKAAAQNAATLNRAESQNAYQDAYGIQSPYINQGQQSYGLLSNFLGTNGQQAQQNAFNNYQSGPDVQWRAQQGVNAIDNSYAARTGGVDSGGLRKAQLNFGTGLATQDMGNYLSRLLSSSALGSSAANNLTNARYQSAGLTTGANTNEGNAIANAALTQGGILGNLITGGMNLAGNLGWNPFGGNSGGSFNQQQGQMTGNRFW